MDGVLDSDLVPEHLKCPICFEVPLGKVFQCKDGHWICESCYGQVRECPQCRVAFGEVQIRNRHIEERLDELQLPCPFQKSGCTETLRRWRLHNHVKSCRFRIAKVESINLCELLGFTECNYQTKRAKMEEAIHHFCHQHGFPINSYPGFNESLVDFSQTIQRIRGITSKPEIVLLGKPTFFSRRNLLVLTVLNEKDQSIAWVPFSTTGEEGNLSSVEFSISRGNNINMPILRWSVEPLDIFKLDKVSSTGYPFKLPTSLLQDYTQEGRLLISCKIIGSFMDLAMWGLILIISIALIVLYSKFV